MYKVYFSVLISYMFAIKKYLPVPLETFDKINDLRIHVAFNFFLITSWFLVSLDVPTVLSIKYALVLFFFVEFSYLFNRYTDYSYDLIIDSAFKKLKRETYLHLSYISLFIGTFLFFYYEDIFTIHYKILIFIVGLISTISYSKGIFFKFPLKNYLVTKNLMSAGSKYFMLIAGAFLLSPSSNFFIISTSLVGFLLNLVFTILWDVRDIEADKVGHVRTLPVVFGRKKTILLCFLLLCFSFLYSVFYLHRYDDVFLTNQIIILSFIIMVAFVKNPRYFHLMVYIMILFILSFNSYGLLFLFGNFDLFLIR